MLTVADENMPFAAEAFGRLGEVRLAPGRKITAEILAGADCLAVRSVTKVNEALLAGSPVRFVGTATIGTDHVDTEWLARAGIGFASAPGSNAVSVAEYVVACLFELAGRLGLTLEGTAFGIVGCGNVGSRVAARARALGMKVVVNDPPLADRTGDLVYRPLEEALACDIVSLHVPLEKAGPYPTWHLAGQSFIGRMNPGAVLFNTSRGAVADSTALHRALGSGRLTAAVLDVWEGEPEIDTELLKKVAIATPHIAGYSFDGKVRGTRMIYEAACRHFGIDPDWDPANLLPPPENPVIEIPAGAKRQEAVGLAVKKSYDILADDGRLRMIAGLPRGEQGKYFDSLRKTYPVRREWASRTVRLPAGMGQLRSVFEGLDFRVETSR
ncbi:MAG: 4-phosphoerythronate dehydrogenase PdxB [Candidatus Glassbacteria bacterium]